MMHLIGRRCRCRTGAAIAAALLIGACAAHAAPSSTIDLLPPDVVGTPNSAVEMGTVRPLTARPPIAEQAPAAPSGNPLWSIPLSTLTATQERPIFSVSRRPPPKAVAAPVMEAAPPPVAAPAAPERPPLALIGAVVGDTESIAVFVDQASQAVVRLRKGEERSGWQLESVLRREVTLRKGDRVETLAIQRAETSAPPSMMGMPAAMMGLPPAMMGAPAPMMNPAGQKVDPETGRPLRAGPTNFAPFTPRATPKNGEHDGL